MVPRHGVIFFHTGASPTARNNILPCVVRRLLQCCAMQVAKRILGVTVAVWLLGAPASPAHAGGRFRKVSASKASKTNEPGKRNNHRAEPPRGSQGHRPPSGSRRKSGYSSWHDKRKRGSGKRGSGRDDMDGIIDVLAGVVTILGNSYDSGDDEYDREAKMPPVGILGGACFPDHSCVGEFECDRGTDLCERPAAGRLGGLCHGDRTCNGGFVCQRDMCRRPQPGGDNGVCYGNQTCNEGLRCDAHANRCVQSKSDEGVEAASLTRDDVRAAVSRHNDGVRHCFERSKLAGTVEVRWRIDDWGEASDVSVVSTDVDDERVARCIVRRVHTIAFPSRPGRADVRVRYPFAYAAER